ncbi:Immunoglobulin-like domain [Trinorchestia longiramus]|nr:Immunoglobulin-like domain [Trinorchestia longiramus]
MSSHMKLVPLLSLTNEMNNSCKSRDGTYSTWSRLEFRGTRFENNRRFSCLASNSVLENRNQRPLSSSETLDIQYAPSVRVTPEQVTVNESVDVLISCEYDANPHQLIYALWYRDQEQLDVAGRPDKYGNGNVDHPSLLIKNVSANDSGAYKCRLTNAVGDSAVLNHAALDVQFAPEVQVLMEPSDPVSEEDHMNVTLVCDVIHANPMTLDRVRWFLGAQLLKELPECDGNDTLYGEDSELCRIDPSRLVLENVTRDFYGFYSCSGMNAAGWGAQSPRRELMVHYPPGQAYITYQPSKVIKSPAGPGPLIYVLWFTMARCYISQAHGKSQISSGPKTSWNTHDNANACRDTGRL